MTRTSQLKSLICAACISFAAAQASAGLPNQPTFDPPAGSDSGAFSVTDQALGGSDPLAAIAYDNFSLTDAYNLSGLTWTGIFAEPLPLARSELDFIVSIWGDSGGAPDISSAPVLQWALDGGFAGGSGPDVTATPNGDVSPMTSTTPGGGEGFDYSAVIGGTLLAGDYWISIQADQRFDNVAPIVDPEWQWHLGSGPDDGFFTEDLAVNQGLIRTIDKDLAFSLQGAIVPEPSALVLFSGVFGLLLTRRRRP